MKDHEKEKTAELIDSLNTVDVNREIAEKASEYKRHEKKQVLELDDCLIASTAFVKKAVLATGNAKHYPMTDIQKTIINA
jgi:predicted nucleic acid-binding protein